MSLQRTKNHLFLFPFPFWTTPGVVKGLFFAQSTWRIRNFVGNRKK